MAFLFTYLDYGLLGALLLVMLYQCYFYLRYLTGVQRQLRKQKKHPLPLDTDNLPGVSVIVCARNEQDNLLHFLPTLLQQDYPRFEVIVVNDGSEDNTQLVLEQYAQKCNNLYLTFVPREARVISSKKLALTIGAKAANYDYLLLTDADCRPLTRTWITDMMQGFMHNPQAEVVLGYGAYFQKPTLLNSLITYDTLFIGLQYMGMALAGVPYMGVGRNLAYKKETFFKNNGFRGMLSEQAGDDDLFVNKVANKRNTAVVSTPASVTWSIPNTSWRGWLHQKRRHLSVSHNYRFGSKLRLVLEPLTRGLFYAILIAVCIWGSSLAVCAAYILWWLRLVMQLCVINISSYLLNKRLYGIEIVAYDIVLPLLSLWILWTQRFRKRRIYW